MRNLSSLGPLTLASVLALVGCGPHIWIDGGGGSTASTGSGAQPDSIAMLASAVPQSLAMTFMEVGGNLAGLDPEALVLVVNSLGETCSSPQVGGVLKEETENDEFVVVGLPPAMQAPGTYALSTYGVLAIGSFLTNGAEAEGGSGPLGLGWIKVVSVDASQVVFSLGSLPDPHFAPLEGEHTAPRCP
jgi:hypothetical protein